MYALVWNVEIYVYTYMYIIWKLIRRRTLMRSIVTCTHTRVITRMHMIIGERIRMNNIRTTYKQYTYNA
jgi:hypothetical protein